MRPWWRPRKDQHDDDDGRDGGNANRKPAKAATPGRRETILCATNVLPLQIEATLQTDAETGRDYAGEHLGGDLRDVEPPPSLLAQPHIRTLLFIDGIYSVCSVLLVDTFSLGVGFSQRHRNSAGCNRLA